MEIIGYKSIRRWAGFTQEHLVEIIGNERISQSSMSRIELKKLESGDTECKRHYDRWIEDLIDSLGFTPPVFEVKFDYEARRIRRESGLTQKDVSGKLGISQTSISHFERCRRYKGKSIRKYIEWLENRGYSKEEHKAV